MDPAAVKALIRRYIDEVWNHQRFALLDDLVTDPTRYRTAITTLHQAYPDLCITIDEIIVEGERVAYRWHASGTHELGVHLHWTGMTFHHLVDGKIAADWFEADRLTLLGQLGIVPAALARDSWINPSSYASGVARP